MRRVFSLLLCPLLLVLAACGGSAADLPLVPLRDAIIASLDMENAAVLDGDSLYSLYGIPAADYTDMAGFQAMNGIFPDECVLVRAADKDAAGRVRDHLQTRLDQVLAQSRDYAPDAYAQARQCAVETDGLTVRLFLSGSREEMERLYQTARSGGALPTLPPTPAATPTPAPTPAPAATSSPTPEPTAAPAPGGLVSESAPAADSWFDDAILVGDSVEYMLTQYVLYQRANGRPDCLGKATLFAASNFSYHLAVSDQQPGEYWPLYNGVFMRVEDAAAACGARKVLIGMGTNDIALLGLDKTMENVETLMSRILDKNPDATIFLMGMTPRPAGYDGSDMPNSLILEFNGRLLSYAEEHGFWYLDSYAALANGQGELPDEYCADLSGQAIHPNRIACGVWLDYLYTHTVPD